MPCWPLAGFMGVSSRGSVGEQDDQLTSPAGWLVGFVVLAEGDRLFITDWAGFWTIEEVTAAPSADGTL